MKIPKTIQIGSQKLRIVWVDEVTVNDSFGCFDPNTNEIKLLKDYPRDRMETIFIHECIEAINTFYNLELDEKNMRVLNEELTSIFKQLQK